MLHRTLIKAPKDCLSCVTEEQEKAEKIALEKVRAIQDIDDSIDEKSRISSECFSQADELTQKWIEVVKGTVPDYLPGYLYRQAWKKRDHKLNFPTT